MTTQPQKIVDKNGKTTTVHKRVDAPDAAAERLAPVKAKYNYESQESDLWIERL